MLFPFAALADAPECSDGIDNDGDGRIDYPLDDDCMSRIDDLERPDAVDFTLTLSDGETYARRGDLLTYVLTVHNNLSIPVTTPLRITLSNLTYVVSAPEDAIERNAQTLEWTAFHLDANATQRLTFTARVIDHTPNGAAMVARASVAGAFATDQTVVQTGITPPADIRVSISDDHDVAAPGDILLYAVTLRNRSSFDAFNLAASASVPFMTDFLTADDGGTFDGATVRWSGIDIPANGSRLLTYTVRVDDAVRTGRILRATGFVEGSEASDSTTIGDTPASSASRSSLSRSSASASSLPAYKKRGYIIVAAADSSEAVAGGTVRYTVSLRNTSDAMLSGLTASAAFDPALQRLTDADGDPRVSRGLLQWSVPPLDPGACWTATFTTVLNQDLPHGTDVAVVASASHDGGETVDEDALRTVNVGVLRQLPATGWAGDTAAVAAFALAAGLLTLAQRRLRTSV